MNVKNFVFNLFCENTIVVSGNGNGCIAVDPSWYTEKERQQFYGYLEEKGLTPEAIFVTHCHFDHLFGVAELQREFGIPVYASPLDGTIMKDTSMEERLHIQAPDTDFTITAIRDGDVLRAAGFSFKVITTPGHTEGSCCFYEENEKILFSGDTLFAGAIGRTDLQGGDYDKEIVSIMDKLMGLPGDTEVCPGHGFRTTIAYERVNNPFLEPFNNKEDFVVPE